MKAEELWIAFTLRRLTPWLRCSFFEYMVSSASLQGTRRGYLRDKQLALELLFQNALNAVTAHSTGTGWCAGPQEYSLAIRLGNGLGIWAR
jgi:hypothetical protein